MNTIYLFIGVFDVIMIMVLGIAAATMVLFGKDMTTLSERVFPAVAILIGTSVAAGIGMAITKWAIGA
jgi:hypothetical protein